MGSKLAAIGFVEDRAPEDAGARPEPPSDLLDRARRIRRSGGRLPGRRRAAPSQPGTTRSLEAIDERRRVFTAVAIELADEFGETGALAAPGDTPEALFERANGALYPAKRDGRNRIAIVAYLAPTLRIW
ncbi:MAG: hypothetical protein ABSA21_03010 [Candidatus Limnocylindrales bacterium]